MTSTARLGCLVLCVVLWSGPALAGKGVGWPKPVGHDIPPAAGPLGVLSQIEWRGDLGVLYERQDADGLEASNALAIRAELGARFQATDYLAINAGIRTGDDFREPRLRFGDGNFDQNFDVSISQLGLVFTPEPLLADRVELNIGRQDLYRPRNDVYGYTLYDEDLVVDGATLRWDCGCGEVEDDPTLLYGAGIGAYKLARYNDDGSPVQDGFASESATMYNVTSYADWRVNDTLSLNPFVNFSFFRNLEDESGTQPSVVQNLQIPDHPEIIQAGLNTRLRIGDLPVTISGEYINNLDADEREDAWTAGIGIDFPACDRYHRFGYLYQDVGAMSLVPTLTQDDHLFGRTGYSGHVVEGEFNTTDRVRFFLQSFISDGDRDTYDDAYRIRFGVEVDFNPAFEAS